jgi:acyl-CoA synthetase (AMP-forming)/AMP-acid ligase II
MFGIAAAGAVQVAINYRLKTDDITYIFTHADVDMIIADFEFVSLLDGFRAENPNVPILVDTDTDATEGELSGPFDDAVLEGLKLDAQSGGAGWTKLESQAPDEDAVFALAYTSGTTARPKGVEYTFRGVYLAAMGNVIESGLNYHTGRAKYLWTLPMFHATGWTFPWAVTAVRGTHYCLRKIDYSAIWALLKTEGITHFNAAPTVNTLLCAAKDASRLAHPVRVTVAASPPSAWLFEQMTNLNLHPVHVYGLTETYGPLQKATTCPRGSACQRRTSTPPWRARATGSSSGCLRASSSRSATTTRLSMCAATASRSARSSSAGISAQRGTTRMPRRRGSCGAAGC